MPDRTEPLPWTRFSYTKFFKDPAVEMMGDDMIGPYLRLLEAAWNAGMHGWHPGYLPAEPLYLSAVSRLLGDRWKGHSAALARAFDTESEPGWWIQRRIVAEYAEARGISEVKAESGRKGGLARAKQVLSKREAYESESIELESRDLRLTESQKKKPRGRATPNLEITPEQITTACEKFPGLPRRQVELLAERVKAESSQRGYRNAYSALLKWLPREKPQLPAGDVDDPHWRDYYERKALEAKT